MGNATITFGKMAEITKTTEMPNLPNDIVVIAINLDIQKNGQKKLPYQHFSNYQPQPSFSQPSFSQPQMTTPMMPQYKPMTQAWSPYYDENMAQNQKYLGKPHITRSFSASPNPSFFPLLMCYPQSLVLHFSQYLLTLPFLLKLLLIQAHFVALCF